MYFSQFQRLRSTILRHQIIRVLLRAIFFPRFADVYLLAVSLLSGERLSPVYTVRALIPFIKAPSSSPNYLRASQSLSYELGNLHHDFTLTCPCSSGSAQKFPTGAEKLYSARFPGHCPGPQGLEDDEAFRNGTFNQVRILEIGTRSHSVDLRE